MTALAIVPDGYVVGELTCETPAGLERRVVPVDLATLRAVRHGWSEYGEVELTLGGRAFAARVDLDGRGIRLTDPRDRMPLAVFRPARRGQGTVVFRDGSTARWIAPDRFAFECGFVSRSGANLVRFAHDGTAIMVVDEVDHERGRAPDPAVMLVLGWLLLWVAGSGRPGRAGRVRAGGGTSAGLGRDDRPGDERGPVSLERVA